MKSGEIWELWRQTITLDPRSLALCRIATGLVIVGDLISRSFDFRMHYTDDGILMRQAIYDLGAARFPSIYMASGWDVFIAGVFLLHGIIAVLLTVGYQTRVTGFLAWYFTVSLQERLYFANNGGDKVLASLLFWAMFVPWGEALSLDSLARRQAGQPGPTAVASAATALFFLQPIMIYWVSVFHKIEPTWLKGQVLQYAFQSDFYAYPQARLLLPYGHLLTLLAYLTLLWEMFGPICLLAPWPKVRGFACLTFIVMHLNFGLFLKIGTFAFTPGLYMLALLPTLFWGTAWGKRIENVSLGVCQRLSKRLASRPGPPLNLSRKAGVALSVLFLYVSLIALSQDKRLTRLTPASLDWVAHLTGLHQRWSVFVDIPNVFDGWIVVEATLADGRKVDLFGGENPPSDAKPSSSLPYYSSFRWPTPLVVITRESQYHHTFVRALARAWEREHPGDRVVWSRFLFYRERPQLDFRQSVEVERILYWQGNPQ